MPTALELTRVGWKPYLEAARQRRLVRTLTPAERAARDALVEKARAAAALLKRHFGARRVILFGSLAHQAWFVPDSDIDLAVDGLSDKDYWRAWRAAEEAIGDRPLDLIDLEIASDSLRQAIQRYGVEL